jgi:hypothetical protein
VAVSSVFLLVLTVAAGTAAPADLDGATERPLPLSTSPVVFAERIAASGTTSRDEESWRTAIELIVLAGTCAIAVAFYSAATAQRTDTNVQERIRRR